MTAPDPSARSVLVVDDDPDLAAALEALLLAEGYAVHAVIDATAALDTASSLRPDVILVDYKMPGMDGATFIQTLRDRGVDSRVVLVTGSGLGEAVAEFLGVQYLAKPFEIETLLACIASGVPRDN